MNPYRTAMYGSADPSEMIGPVMQVSEEEPLLPDELPQEFYMSLMTLADQGPDWVPGVNLLTTFDTLGGFDEF